MRKQNMFKFPDNHAIDLSLLCGYYIHPKPDSNGRLTLTARWLKNGSPHDMYEYRDIDHDRFAKVIEKMEEAMGVKNLNDG